MSFPLTLLCWVKARVGLELPVELAGDVADQAASDFTVGLALSPSPLGVGAGGWVVAESLVRTTKCRAWLSCRSPERLSRTRIVCPEEAGIGAAPPSIAKAASVRQRPGCDQAQSTMAATIGPTPVRLSRSGRQARTRVVMARVCSAISVSRSWMRRASARRVAATVVVSVSQLAGSRSRPQAVTSWRVVKARSRLRSASGAATTSAWSWRWASVAAWTAERRVVSRT
jgi:hypothetical protein